MFNQKLEHPYFTATDFEGFNILKFNNKTVDTISTSEDFPFYCALDNQFLRILISILISILTLGILASVFIHYCYESE